MTVAIYVRTSKIDQNPENQKIDLINFAKAQGWEYVIFEEQETTRKTRPIKNEVFKRTCMLEYDGILVWKLDRWARSLMELIYDLERLKQNKRMFYSLKDGISVDDKPINRFFVHILGAFAEFERDIIRQRTMAGLARAKAQGKRLGRPKKDKK